MQHGTCRMTTDVCLIWPAINAVREGYNVQVTVRCLRAQTALPHHEEVRSATAQVHRETWHAQHTDARLS